MADDRQPDGHWASNGQENGENGYSAYSSAYRENGYHGGAAAHPGSTGRLDLLESAKACACKSSGIDLNTHTHTYQVHITAGSDFVGSVISSKANQSPLGT